ncbi:MAG: UDP-GlcNAc:undecaprenyl-phosphate GlcNAc-1-phosphate transferase [Pirellulaceae bacterium]|jgi:UDP-GlcNAc:undecaprenyl-phosphate GlcNAc-1-phosphate transferase
MSGGDFSMLLIGALLPSFFLSAAIGFVVRRNAASWGLVDEPGGHKSHTRVVPLGGGLAIAAAVLITFALAQFVLYFGVTNDIVRDRIPEFAKFHIDGLWASTRSLWTILGAGLVLMALGLVDDLRGVNWRIRLVVQLVVAVTCIYLEGWQLTAFIPYPGLTTLLTALWIVTLINAFNMLDNMDGLSGGVATTAAVVLAVTMLTPPYAESTGPQIFVGGFCLVLAGAVLGFLVHNAPPAKLFMGDAGSYFVGFCLAIGTLQGTYANYDALPTHAVLTPICIMAIPLYDLCSVIVVRLYQGRSPFEGDNQHFSHRLVQLGLSRSRAVCVICVASTICGAAGVVLRWVSGLQAILIAVVLLMVLVAIALAELRASRSRC